MSACNPPKRTLMSESSKIAISAKDYTELRRIKSSSKMDEMRGAWPQTMLDVDYQMQKGWRQNNLRRMAPGPGRPARALAGWRISG
ncbi:MAG: hypothetical protein Q8S17_01495 [Humidesulfovibrio sp.]|nr:hypothetical protein [Humidesulfovibrio sp.]